MEEIEKYRKKIAKKISIIALIAITITVIFFVLNIAPAMNSRAVFDNTLVLATSLPWIILFMIGMIGIAIYLFVWRSGDVENYRKAYKDFFVRRILEKTITELCYDHKAGLTIAPLIATGMIRIGDRSQSNDYISGKYKDVKFQQSDIKMQEKRKSKDGSDYYVTIFKGRWLEFEFPKQFKYRLEVAEKGFRNNIVPKNQNGKKFEKIETESGTFNKKFKVYAEDGVEAFYILDPAMISRIEQFDKLHRAKYLFCFKDDKLSVGVQQRRDNFEPPNPFKKVNEMKELNKVTAEISLITNLVDYLRLDKKIFKSGKS